jgi:hypothetical protein
MSLHFDDAVPSRPLPSQEWNSNKMNLRFLLVRSVAATALLGAVNAQAQNAAPPGDSGLPDACKLMPQSDLESLFPGMPVDSKGPTLSPIFQGPQYNSSCMYSVKLASPTSKLDTAKLISLTVIKCDMCYLKNKTSATEVFANIRDTKEKVAANPSLHMQLEPLPDIGEEALQVTTDHDVSIYARKDDLVFFLSIAKYSRQTQPNAVALAGQVAKRWRGGVGMVEAATPIAANTSVDLPPDTRVVATASAKEWPDACVLLTPDDVRAVFGDMTVGQPRKTMGEIKFDSRVDRVEKLPYPMRCSYEAHKTTVVNGQRQVITNTIDLNVEDVATSVDFAKKHYAVALKVGEADTAVPGLGDEASIDIMNRIYIRKGVLMVAVRVGGGERDQALHADARKRVNEIAKLVAAKLP